MECCGLAEWHLLLQAAGREPDRSDKKAYVTKIGLCEFSEDALLIFHQDGIHPVYVGIQNSTRERQRDGVLQENKSCHQYDS